MRPSLPRVCAAFLPLCLFFVGCGGGNPFRPAVNVGTMTPQTPDTRPVTNPVTVPVAVTNGPSISTASVSVMISDPAACKAPNGPFAHVYITLTDVMASTNPDAPANDPSFVDLTPGLSNAPQQVDLLGQPNSQCFLASLSVSQQVAAGNYQQIRIFLAPNSAASTVANNACGASYANCIVLSDNSLHDLVLPPATASGIQIATNAMANASIAVNANEQPAIDLNFDTCSSILQTSDGEYEFSPMVHAGLVGTSGGTIAGTVVSSTTAQPLQGGLVVVALEQKDPKTGIDRILMRTAAGSNGAFVLCPVPQGTYDLVAVGVDGAQVSYSAGVETGIQAGQLAGEIPLVPGGAQGTLEGMITTQNTGPPPVGVSVAVKASALQQISNMGVTITVPLLPSQSAYNDAMLTTSGSNCATGVDCGSFAMQLPSSAPNVVACSEQTAQFTQQPGSPPNYIAASFAEIPGSGGVPDCTANQLSVTATPQGRSIVLNADQSTTAASMAYTQCE